MPPPGQRQQFDRALAAQVAGGQFTPEQLALLARVNTPGQIAQFQQQYAQVTQPAIDPMFARTPTPAPTATDAFTPQTAYAPPPAPVMPAEQGSGALLYRNPADAAPTISSPNRGTIGMAPPAPEGGSAEFGSPGTGNRERNQGPTQALNPDLYPGQGPSGRPEEASTSEGGASARTELRGRDVGGNAIFVVGDGQFTVPANILADPQAYRAWVQAHRSSGGQPMDLSDPNNPRLDEVAADQAIQQYPRLFEQQWGAAPTGPGEPRMSARLDQEIRLPGHMSPETAARLGLADQGVEQARGGIAASEDASFMGRTLAADALGGAQAAEAADMEARAAERQQRVQTGLQDLHRRLDDVAGMRVDVNEAFGGFGGRMGAAIAVALGQLGSALGGGENTALAIVNASIDRNLAMQRSNIDSARADASARGTAFRLMVDSLGDEEAATQAARALHLTAVATSMNGFINGLDQQRAAAARAFQQRLLEQSLVARQAAAEIAATATEASLRTEFRGPQSAVQGQISGMLGSGQGQVPARPAASGHAPVPSGQAQQPTTQRQTQTGSGPRTQTGAPSARPARAPTPGRAPSPEDVTAMQADWQTERPPVLPPGVRYLRGEGTSNQAATAQRAFEDMMRNGGPRAQAAVREAITISLSIGNAVDRITATNDALNAELIPGAEPTAALARALARNIRTRIRRIETGAAFSEAERQESIDRFPEPTARDLENITEWFDRFENTWRAEATALLEAQRDVLYPYGLEPDSAVRPGTRVAQEQLDAQNTAAQAQSSAPEPSLWDRAVDSSVGASVARRVLGN